MLRNSRVRTVTSQWVVLASCVGLTLLGCVGPTLTEDVADPEADAQAVVDAHHAFVDAYQRGNARDLVLALDKTGDLLIFHAERQDRWTSVEEVQQNVGLMFARLGESKWSDVHLDVKVEGDVAWLTSHVVIESPNLAVPFTGRGTEVWVRRGGNWRLTHAHWSPNPEF